jgi:hypothetical protein
MKLILLINPIPVDWKEERIPSSLRCLAAERSFSTTYPGFSLTNLCRHYYPLFSLHFLTLICLGSHRTTQLSFFFLRGYVSPTARSLSMIPICFILYVGHGDF